MTTPTLAQRWAADESLRAQHPLAGRPPRWVTDGIDADTPQGAPLGPDGEPDGPDLLEELFDTDSGGLAVSALRDDGHVGLTFDPDGDARTVRLAPDDAQLLADVLDEEHSGSDEVDITTVPGLDDDIDVTNDGETFTLTHDEHDVTLTPEQASHVADTLRDYADHATPVPLDEQGTSITPDVDFGVGFDERGWGVFDSRVPVRALVDALLTRARKPRVPFREDLVDRVPKGHAKVDKSGPGQFVASPVSTAMHALGEAVVDALTDDKPGSSKVGKNAAPRPRAPRKAPAAPRKAAVPKATKAAPAKAAVPTGASRLRAKADWLEEHATDPDQVADARSEAQRLRVQADEYEKADAAFGEPLRRRVPRAGDVAVWTSPADGGRAVGRVRRNGRRLVIAWEGGREEPIGGGGVDRVPRTVDPDITLYSPGAVPGPAATKVAKAGAVKATPAGTRLTPAQAARELHGPEDWAQAARDGRVSRPAAARRLREFAQGQMDSAAYIGLGDPDSKLDPDRLAEKRRRQAEAARLRALADEIEARPVKATPAKKLPAGLRIEVTDTRPGYGTPTRLSAFSHDTEIAELHYDPFAREWVLTDVADGEGVTSSERRFRTKPAALKALDVRARELHGAPVESPAKKAVKAAAPGRVAEPQPAKAAPAKVKIVRDRGLIDGLSPREHADKMAGLSVQEFADYIDRHGFTVHELDGIRHRQSEQISGDEDRFHQSWRGGSKAELRQAIVDAHKRRLEKAAAVTDLERGLADWLDKELVGFSGSDYEKHVVAQVAEGLRVGRFGGEGAARVLSLKARGFGGHRYERLDDLAERFEMHHSLVAADDGGKGLHSKANILSTYELVDAPTGLRTRVAGMTENSWRDEYAVETGRVGWTAIHVEVEDGQGEHVGDATFEVSPDGQVIHHSDLVIDDEFRGQGFATRQMLHILAAYREHGVKRMTLTANSDVGGYAWARAGFQFRDDEARAKLAAAARRWLERDADNAGYDEALRAELERVANNPAALPIEFAMAGHRPGADMWLGKEFMLGSTWDAVMDL